VKPLPETVQALRELAIRGEADLGTQLFAMATRIRELVPELVGLSLGMLEDQVTLTLVSSTEEIAAIDAVQYLDGGPCIDALQGPSDIEVAVADLFDEARWQMYARATAAMGVASSLSLPVSHEGRVVGGVNLYATTADAFEGLHEAIAGAVGSTAEQAVANADLSFSTQLQARRAPDRVREQADIDIAVGIIAESQQVDVAQARQRLRDAAARAGISEFQAAKVFRRVRTD